MQHRYYNIASNATVRTQKCQFDTDYTDSKKSETTNILVIEAREYLNKQKLSKSFFLITDDSILDLLDSGAGFVHLTVQKSFTLDKVFPYSHRNAMLMTLNYVYNIPLAFFIYIF